MRRPQRQFLASILALLCFGLNCTVLNGSMVFCTHADGTSEIEWGACTSDPAGICLADCTDGDQDSLPGASATADSGPCKDIPVKNEHHAAKTPPSPAPRQIFAPAPLVAAITAVLAPEPVSIPVPARARACTPHGCLASIRTVILLV